MTECEVLISRVWYPPHHILINNMHIPLCHSLYDSNCPWWFTLISQQSTIVLYRYLEMFTSEFFQVMDLGFYGGLYVYVRSPLTCHSIISSIQTVNSPQRSGERYWMGVISLPNPRALTSPTGWHRCPLSQWKLPLFQVFSEEFKEVACDLGYLCAC